MLEPPSSNEFVRQELVETTYHVLWELVHVFFEHRGLLEGRTERRAHDAGASSFLYPFLAEREHDLDAVLADVRASVLMKADEVQELRVATLQGATLGARRGRRRDAREPAMPVDGCSRSATAVRRPTRPTPSPTSSRRRPSSAGRRAARSISSPTPAIITAIANDIGTEAIFARQVIAHGRAGDVLLALSTSGSSLSVLDALAEARRRELVTIALVGYDGGRVAAEQLADHIIVTPSQHIPRIQEAQATAYHVLRELVERE